MARIFVLGSLNADLVIEVARPPRRGETLSGGELQAHPGGKGANQAVAAAKLGGRVLMAGALGSDGYGDLLLESQRSAGVDTTHIERSHSPSGVAVITVFPDGENSIVISPGANATLTPKFARAALADITKSDYLLCQLESPLETVDAALRQARSAGATTILDPAPARDLPRSILSRVDILTPNEIEAATLLGEKKLRDPEATALDLLTLGPKTVILKLGSKGSLTVTKTGTRLRTPAFHVDVVDSTAAGDTFNAALAVALSEGQGLAEAGRFANAAAALSVTKPGAQPSAPTRAELDEFVSQPAG